MQNIHFSSTRKQNHLRISLFTYRYYCIIEINGSKWLLTRPVVAQAVSSKNKIRQNNAGSEKHGKGRKKGTGQTLRVEGEIDKRISKEKKH